MSHRTASEGYRVLIVAPFGRDAESLRRVLADQGYDAACFADADAMASAIDDHTGVALLTEEALRTDLARLHGVLDAQPGWSDIPFIILSTRRTGATPKEEAARTALGGLVTNPTVLERPIGTASLTSAVASAMRSRQKQFQMRDRLRDLEAGREALRASEAELRLVADSMPVAISFVDRDLRYRFANRVYEDWVYIPAHDLIGRELRDVLGPAVFASREPEMRKALAGQPRHTQMSWPHRDGRRREADVRYLPRHAADGSVDGFHVFALDVTERREAEELLESRVAERTQALTLEMENRANAEAALRQSQKMEAVGQLTGGIAHDFNNMLTGVLGSLDIMRRRIASGRTDDLDRFMNSAANAAHRAAGLTSRLLAFSRRQSLDSRPLDVNALMASLEDLLKSTIRENVSLRIVPGNGLPLAIADSNQLENAILNLAINARDAMPEGGELTVASRRVELAPGEAQKVAEAKPGHYVVVSVSDTGVGMGPDILEKVFDPFFTTKPIGQGTGLGLSMVYGFARQSGGHVQIDSRPGAGTTVSIFLPQAQAPAEGAADQPAAVPEGQGQTVLLVEDDDTVRLLVRDALGELSYHAIEAAEAQAAVDILASDRAIDLLISDVGLPGMNGRQLADVARHYRPALPILFITGYAENAAIRASFLGKNMSMIMKPFSMDALASKVSELMRHDP